MHSVVYSFDPATRALTNLNRDVLNLDPFVSYTIPEYLEDRASEGASCIRAIGTEYLFSDGTSEILVQQVEPYSLQAVAHA